MGPQEPRPLSRPPISIGRVRAPRGRREEQDGQAPRALSAVDDHPLDVARGRRTRQEDAIRAGCEVDPPMAPTNGAVAVASGILRSVSFRVVKVPVTV